MKPFGRGKVAPIEKQFLIGKVVYLVKTAEPPYGFIRDPYGIDYHFAQPNVQNVNGGWDRLAVGSIVTFRMIQASTKAHFVIYRHLPTMEQINERASWKSVELTPEVRVWLRKQYELPAWERT